MSKSVSTRTRFATPFAMFVREYYRAPLNVVLLFVIPVTFILAFGDSLSRLGDLFDVTLTADMGNSLAALWAASFLTGIMGFFMLTGARSADRRLVRAGYRTVEVVAIRFAAVAVLGAVTTLTSFGFLLLKVTPTDYPQTLAIFFLAALTYGALGILIGSLIWGELEGSFALIFFFMMDAFIGSPLFGTTSQAFAFLPTFYPAKVLFALTADQPHVSIHWLYVSAYFLVVTLLAVGAFYRAARLR